MLSRAAVAGIGLYQRFVSPRKGFRCAYHALHGRGSCSDVALRLAGRFGLRRMLRLMPLQGARCRHALAVLRASRDEDGKRSPSGDCAKLAALYCAVDCCPL